MMLYALVKDKRTSEVVILDDDSYRSKEAFWRDLEANGYTVRRISTEWDLKALEVGFETWAALVKHDNACYQVTGDWSVHHNIIIGRNDKNEPEEN